MVKGEIVFYMMPIAENLIGGYCFYRLSKPFMENKKRVFYVGAAYFLIMLILYIIPLKLNIFAAYATGVFTIFLVMCRLDKRNYEQKAFVAVTFFSLRWFAFAMAEILYDNLYSFAENTDYMIAHPNMWFALYVGVCLFFLVMEFIFMDIGIRCILRNYIYKNSLISKKELLMLIIPSFMGVVGYEVIWSYRNLYISELKKISYMFDILSLLYYAVAVITIAVVIVLYQDIKARQEEKLQNELLATQLDSIMQHIEQVENLYEDIHSIKHDMTNHIIILERLYAGNKTKEAKAYSTDLKAVLSLTPGNIASGNPVTDVILQEMQRKAEKKNICFDVDFHFPTGSKINSFDISVILNNALQNALENTEKTQVPYISVLSYGRNNAYMIEINNSFTGNLQWDMERGLPVTLKEKEDGHGYGLANIRRVAEKYSGDIAVDVQDGKFCLSILLMLE